MSMKSLFLSAAVGLAGLSLSGCVYDGGPYYYGGPGPYYGGGYYASGAIIYDRGGYYRHRYPRYHRHPGGDHQHRPPLRPQPPQAQRPSPPPRVPVVVNRGGENRGQQGQIFLPPEEGYRHN
ncbi:MAG: hypothetical protein WBA88_12840 [Pseudaminobacter sp.]